MSQRRIDALSRHLAATGTRRRLTVRLLAGGLGTALGRLGLAGERAVAARCRRPGRKCTRSRECCGSARCRRKRCRCLPGTKPCGKSCCPRDHLCRKGTCAPPPAGGTCRPGEDRCSDRPDNIVRCNEQDGCFCVSTVEGLPICLRFEGACVVCRSSADCLRLGFPPGSGCIDKVPRGSCGPGCTEEGSMCLAPCPLVPPAPAQAEGTASQPRQDISA